MTDRDSPDPTGLSEDDVARLLASVGDAEPVPDEVRTRLEDTLAALVDERGAEDSPSEDAGSEPAPVVPLRRAGRSGAGRRLLAAAAVLGVVGLGVGVAAGLAGDLTGGESDSSTAGSASESAQESGDAGADESGSEAEADAGGRDGGVTDAPQDAPEELSAAGDVPEVGTERALRSTVRALAVAPASLEGGSDTLSALQDRAAAQSGCATPRVRDATRSLVTYRGADATLVVRRDGERVEGRVYGCSLGLLLDGLSIPSPEE